MSKLVKRVTHHPNLGREARKRERFRVEPATCDALSSRQRAPNRTLRVGDAARGSLLQLCCVPPVPPDRGICTNLAQPPHSRRDVRTFRISPGRRDQLMLDELCCFLGIREKTVTVATHGLASGPRSREGIACRDNSDGGAELCLCHQCSVELNLLAASRPRMSSSVPPQSRRLDWSPANWRRNCG